MSSIFETKYSSEFGRYLVAKKCFHQGDEILAETPLYLGPHSGKISEGESEMETICYGCYKLIEINSAVQCPRCKWYACSEGCVKEAWHTNFECILFEREDIAPKYSSFKHLFIARILMFKERDEPAWSEILELASTMQISDPQLEANHDAYADEVLTFLNGDCAMNVEKDMILKLMRTLFINSFEMKDKDEDGNQYCGQALFATSCLIAHSCSPNADWVLLSTNSGPEKRWHLTLYARKDIKIGEDLTIPYTQEFVTFGTIKRRLRMKETLRFICRCSRCSDPSELNTNYSGIKCQKCTGVFLPIEDEALCTDWKCNQCGSKMTEHQAQQFENRFKPLLSNVLENTTGQTSCEQLDSLIKSGVVIYRLHDNHSQMMQAKLNWVTRMDLNVLLGRGKNVLKIYNTLMCRVKNCIHVTSTIGDIISWITCERIIVDVIVKYRFKTDNYRSIKFNGYPVAELTPILKRIVKHLQRALRLMRSNVAYNDELAEEQTPLSDMLKYYNAKLGETAKHALNFGDSDAPEGK